MVAHITIRTTHTYNRLDSQYISYFIPQQQQISTFSKPIPRK